MADTWYVRKSGTVIGPFTSMQLRQMAVEGRIDEHTPVGKDRAGPFASAGKVKGLIPHHGVPADPGDTDKRLDSLPPGAYLDEVDRESITAKIPSAEHPAAFAAADHPLLALWTLAISAGMVTAMVIYGLAWKFSGPVWAYGAALVPLAVTLFLVGGYPYLSHRTRLNRTAVLVNGVFLALTLVAGAGSIYQMWTLESRFNSVPRERFQMPQ
jgi:hypothetical protein